MTDYANVIQDYRTKLAAIDQEIAVLKSQEKEFQERETILKQKLKDMGCTDQVALEIKLADLTRKMNALIQDIEGFDDDSK